MINALENVDPMYILGTIIATLLLIYFLLPRWSRRNESKYSVVHKDKTKNAPQQEAHFGPKPRTIRIQNIPPSFTKQSLVDFLDLQNEGISVIKSSFGPSPVRTKTTNRAVAVVTLSGLPKSLTQRLRNDECQLESGINQTVQIDLHFKGLTPLNDVSATAKVDLVFVTGLAGHAYGSWKASNLETMWIQDFLAPDLVVSDVRILTYGYDSALLESTSNAGLREFAFQFLCALDSARRNSEELMRPLLLVGHSLGGLVIKKALLCAEEMHDQYQNILLSTCAIFFLGVPNQGLSTDRLENMVKDQPNKQLVENLRQESDYLFELVTSFRALFKTKLVGSIAITIFETRQTPTVEKSKETGKWARTGPPVLMVTKESAIDFALNDNPADRYPRDVNHSGLSKFTDRNEGDYIWLCNKIKTSLKTTDVIMSRFSPGLAGKNVSDELPLDLPCATDAIFTSKIWDHESRCLPGTRVSILEEIITWSEGSNSAHLFWLCGMAGTGKSTIARTVTRKLDEAGRLAATFFFARGKGDISRANLFVPTLAKQLAKTIPGYRSLLIDVLTVDLNLSDLGLREQWRQLIMKPLSQLDQSGDKTGQYCIVIDALDECNNEEDIVIALELIQQMEAFRHLRILTLVTSRPDTATQQGMSFYSLDMHQDVSLNDKSSSNTAEDLYLYFESRLGDLLRKSNLLYEETLQKFVALADGLFIWASTVCRFIVQSRVLAGKRLRMVLRSNTTLGQSEKGIDEIYLLIIKSSFQDQIGLLSASEEQELYSMFRKIVGSLVVSIAPLSPSSLALLLDIDELDVVSTLNGLTSIIQVGDHQEPIRVLHQSFRDFIQNPDRCTSNEYVVVEEAAHEMLARACLKVMSSLKRDICNLRLPGTELQNVSQETIETYIPPVLRYACLYWGRHLEDKQEKNHELDTLVEGFLKTKFLYWLEVMIILKGINQAILVLNALERLKMDTTFVRDAMAFIVEHRFIIEQAPLQIYESALFFSPEDSLIRQIFGHEHPKWVHRLNRSGAYDVSLLTLEGHQSVVKSVTFSSDCRFAASASFDRSARIWSIDTASCVHTLEGHSDIVYDVSFSPDGAFLASGSSDKTIILWDTSSGVQSRKLEGHPGMVYTLQFSPDGKFLASGCTEGEVKLWEIVDGSNSKTLSGHTERVNQVDISTDSKMVASASHDSTIRVWSIQGQLLHLLRKPDYTGFLNSVKFSKDCTTISCVQSGGIINQWSLMNNNVSSKKMKDDIYAEFVAFSPSGRYIASTLGGTMQLAVWDITSGRKVADMSGHSEEVIGAAFSTDGKRLISANCDSMCKIWDATPQSFALADENRAHKEPVLCIKVSPDGKLGITGSYDGAISVWDLTTGARERQLKSHSGPIEDVCCSESGKWLVSCSSNENSRLWCMKTFTLRHILGGSADTLTSAKCATFSSDDNMVALAGDVSIIVYRVETGEVLQTVDKFDERPQAIAFLSDNSFVATLTDRSFKIWQLADAKFLWAMDRNWKRTNEIPTSPDGQLVALLESGTAQIDLWEVASGGAMMSLEVDGKSFMRVTFSPNDNLVAGLTDDYHVYIFERSTGSVLSSWKGDIVNIQDFWSHVQITHNPDHGYKIVNTLDVVYIQDSCWLSFKGKKLMWLPSGMRPVSFTTNKRKAGVGNVCIWAHGTGHVSILQIEPKYLYDFENM